jgi:hypothetical protein
MEKNNSLVVEEFLNDPQNSNKHKKLANFESDKQNLTIKIQKLRFFKKF